MNPIPNRRQYPRHVAYIIVEYTVKEGTYRDVIKNIGAGGLSVRTSRKINDGQSIMLKFPLFQFENTIQVSGKVARSNSDGFAVTFNEPIRGLICKEGQFPEIVHEVNR